MSGFFGGGGGGIAGWTTSEDAGDAYFTSTNAGGTAFVQARTSGDNATPGTQLILESGASGGQGNQAYVQLQGGPADGSTGNITIEGGAVQINGGQGVSVNGTTFNGPDITRSGNLAIDAAGVGSTFDLTADADITIESSTGTLQFTGDADLLFYATTGDIEMLSITGAVDIGGPSGVDITGSLNVNGNDLGAVTAFTPTTTHVANVTWTGYWQYVGPKTVRIAYTGVYSGATTAASLVLDLPAGITVDETNMTTAELVGMGQIWDDSASASNPNRGPITITYAVVDNRLYASVLGTAPSTLTAVSNTVPITLANLDRFHATVTLTIL